jgi:hypothetical protein
LRRLKATGLRFIWLDSQRCKEVVMIWFIFAFLWVVLGLLAAIAFGRMCRLSSDHVHATADLVEYLQLAETGPKELREDASPELDGHMIARKVAGIGRR